jgi:GNAT superfamily N-acetyltransferase
MNNFDILPTTLEGLGEIIRSHMHTLAYPVDSWLEGRLRESTFHAFLLKGTLIGYGGLIKDTLHFFHVTKDYFRYAPALLENIIGDREVKRVFVMTQDSLLCALVSEWDYEKEKQACWFSDGGRVDQPETHVSRATFRAANARDVERIRKVAGDFFDEAGSGFTCLEERIEGETIFTLEERESLLGCGIVEKSQVYPGVVSIGMFANRDHRRKGVAKTILLHLKEWAYKNKLRPVAGCWYYNTLSRKSLESAGMIATSMGFNAVLKGKEKVPLRTGNPPGEVVFL